MAFFIATGVISNDVVRRETTKGVLTTFRLETGAPRGRKLWIDIECWGHLAGTIARHGSKGRGVSVSGRLTQKTWRDKSTGGARQRIVVTALDVDLGTLTGEATGAQPLNTILLTGAVTTLLPARSAGTGMIRSFIVCEQPGRAIHGKLRILVESWTAGTVGAPSEGDRTAISGALQHTARSDDTPLGLVINTTISV